MLLGESLSENMLAGKGVIRGGEGTARVLTMDLRDLHFDSTTFFNKL